jgi:hypothetical protein
MFYKNIDFISLLILFSFIIIISTLSKFVNLEQFRHHLKVGQIVNYRTLKSSKKHKGKIISIINHGVTLFDCETMQTWCVKRKKIFPVKETNV